MKNIYIIRPKGFNIGNDVISIALLHFMRKNIKLNFNVISLPATSKYENHKKSGLTAQTIHEINQFGNGLIVGGGNLYENGELEINKTALQALDVPMMIFSVSRGKIYNKDLNLVDRTDVMTDDNIKAINKKADISLARDIATKSYLESLGCENSVLGGCPTLFLNEMSEYLMPISEHSKTDALISVRDPALMNIPFQYKHKVRDYIIDAIKLLKSKGYLNVKLLCHDHRDIPFASSFSNIDYFYTDNVFEYLSYLRYTRCNITFRLHSFLPCMSYGVNAINISYDQRASSMIETIGMKEWDINLLTDNVLENIEDRLNNFEKLYYLRESLQSSLWKDLKQTIDINIEKFGVMIDEK